VRERVLPVEATESQTQPKEPKMQSQPCHDIRDLKAVEIDMASGGVNPWVVRIAAKLIIAVIDRIGDNGVDGRSVPRAERETGNRV
jgi:hypothetical protein